MSSLSPVPYASPLLTNIKDQLRKLSAFSAPSLSHKSLKSTKSMKSLNTPSWSIVSSSRNDDMDKYDNGNSNGYISLDDMSQSCVQRLSSTETTTVSELFGNE